MWSAVESGEDAAGAGEGAGAAPCARGKHSAALLGAHVYVLGGRGAGGAVPLRDFWRYSLEEGTWEALPARGSPPPALQEHSCTAYGARLYVFGGESAPGTDTPLWIYDTETGEWRKLAGQSGWSIKRRGPRDAGRHAAPRGRRGHSAHTLKDCLLIYGGYQDLKGSTNELWAFHYETESWQAVRAGGAGAGPARHRHAAALHGARLYVHAGCTDLRAQADLWHYDTISRVWTCVRTPPRQSPAARSGHAGLRAGAHFYIFGGEVNGQLTNELWRFHFGSETWERMEQGLQWPSPRVDCRALLVPSAPKLRPSAAAVTGAGRNGADETAAAVVSRSEAPRLLREISKLSSFHMRRAARCSYSALAAGSDRDSTESIPRDAALAKSQSAVGLARLAARGGEVIGGADSPREADAADHDIAHEPISVPDFADMVLPTPVLSPAEAAKLVYLDSEEEEDARRWGSTRTPRVPKSASVRFTADSVTITTEEEEGALSTSDYASAERVNRLSGFSNPHYLGPDVRRLGAALTPDSGLGGGDIELQDLRAKRTTGSATAGGRSLHVLLVGGRSPWHAARLRGPLALWAYRLL